MGALHEAASAAVQPTHAILHGPKVLTTGIKQQISTITENLSKIAVTVRWVKSNEVLRKCLN